MTKPLVYEHPITQPARHFLRLENAFLHLDQLLANTNQPSTQSTASLQAAFLHLTHLLDFLVRVDIKAEIIKELESQINFYRDLQSNPAVDKTKLDTFLEQLGRLHKWAIQLQGKIGDSIRKDDFIQTILHKQSLQTGVTSCDSPELYNFFYSGSNDITQHLLDYWKPLDGLKTSISVILRLTRELSAWETVEAPMGDYLIEKPAPTTTLVRIQLEDPEIFPEVSAGKHRIAIHFYQLDSDLKRKKCSNPVKFKLGICS